MNAPPTVVAITEDGRSGFRFTCGVCGRRSALFSLKKTAEEQARTHPNRCPK